MRTRFYGVGPFLLVILIAGCESKSEAERERESGVGQRSTTPPAKVSADGSIQLSPQQVQANAIRTVMPREETLAPAIAVVGRVQAEPVSEESLENETVRGFPVPGRGRAGPSWAAGVARDGKDERDGSNGGGLMYN